MKNNKFIKGILAIVLAFVFFTVSACGLIDNGDDDGATDDPVVVTPDVDDIGSSPSATIPRCATLSQQ